MFKESGTWDIIALVDAIYLKHDKMTRLSSCHPGFFLSLFLFMWKPVRDGKGGQRGRGTLKLASHGEFFIGAGNVALVTVALSGPGISVVLSNRAWSGRKKKKVTNMPLL